MQKTEMCNKSRNTSTTLHRWCAQKKKVKVQSSDECFELSHASHYEQDSVVLSPALVNQGSGLDAVVLAEFGDEIVAEIDLGRNPRQEQRNHVDQPAVVIEAKHDVGHRETGNTTDQVVDVRGTELEVPADLGDIDCMRAQTARHETSDGAREEPEQERNDGCESDFHWTLFRLDVEDETTG